MSSEKFHKLLHSFSVKHLAIAVLCLVCYGDKLNGDFVFDDTVAIVKNSDVTNFRRNIKEIFHHDFWGGNLSETSHKSYRPFTTLTFRIESQIYGLNPTRMKFVNLALHIVISCGILHVGKLFYKSSIPFVAAILFACHPIHTEAVSGIVGRADLLACLLFLVAVAFYFNKVIRNRPGFFGTGGFATIIVSVLTLCAVLCKETGITILPTILALDVLFNTNVKECICNRQRLLLLPKPVVLRSLALLLVTIAILVLRFMIVDFKSPNFKVMDNPIAANDNFLIRITNQNFLYALNFWLLLCPDWLSFDWALGSITLIDSLSDARLIGIIIFILFLITISIKSSRNESISMVFLIIPFLPASGIIRLGFVVAERVLYTPSIGYTFLIAIGFDKLSSKLENFTKIAAFLRVGLCLCIATFVLKTRHRAGQWATEEELFTSGLRVCPNNAKVHYNIARLASDHNDREKAFKFYHSAIKLYPEYESAIMNLGNLYREIGRLDKAEMYLKESIQILPAFPAAWMNLGIVQASLGRHEESLLSYKTALKYRQYYPTCLYNMGNLYIEMKDFGKAMKAWHDVISLNPKHVKAWSNILALLDNQGKTDQVLEISDLALQAVPDEPGILFTRANAFGKLGDYKESERIFLKIIKERPNVAIYYANLGVLYHRWKKYSKAKECYTNALRLDPNMRSAKTNLKKLE